jgi:16S rRNA (cytosine967-C5)-methyltransferase
LLQAVRAGRSLTEALQGCPSELRPGAQALIFHTLRHVGGAEAARNRLVPKAPPPAVDSVLITALALLWPSSTQPPPYTDHTLVDQAVECVRLRQPGSAGFINAVLRRFLRERHLLVEQLQATDPVARYQHPKWWIDKVRQDWPEQASALLEAANVQPPMTLRVNARHSNATRYAEALAQVGIDAKVVGSHALVLAQAVPVHRLPGFEQGHVSVQDESAQLAAPLLLGEGADALPAKSRVLDACAAPGGKTAHLLELQDLDLLALDVDSERLTKVAQTLERQGLRATLRVGDAAQPSTWWDGRPFDAILLDAPCSASGIVRRHPDIRWLRRPTDITTLARTQARLLDALWPLLAPGGRLIYATCSLFRAEGTEQIDAFLQRTPHVIRRPAPGHRLLLGENASGSVKNDSEAGDSFYYARLDKPGSAGPSI